MYLLEQCYILGLGAALCVCSQLCTLYFVLYILYFILCTLYFILCTLYFVLCVLCTLYFILCNFTVYFILWGLGALRERGVYVESERGEELYPQYKVYSIECTLRVESERGEERGARGCRTVYSKSVQYKVYSIEARGDEGRRQMVAAPGAN